MNLCTLWRCALVILVAGCAYETHQRRLTIAADPVPCADGTPGSCLYVIDAAGDTWVTRLDETEGFTYEPGFTYELLVEDPTEAAEIEAASPLRPKLIEVLSKQASGATSPGRGDRLDLSLSDGSGMAFQAARP